MDYLLAIYLVLYVYTKKSINQSNLMHSINVKVKISLSQLNKKSISILIRCKNEYFLMIQPKPVSLSVISVLLVCRRKPNDTTFHTDTSLFVDYGPYFSYFFSHEYLKCFHFSSGLLF